jgi:uncharacterized membrane protein YraQ (UPF0718 family)
MKEWKAFAIFAAVFLAAFFIAGAISVFVSKEPVIRSIIGTKKIVVYVGLVVIMATTTGLIYGYFF